MPTTLTLKYIPDVLYDRLRRSAATHRRSINSEAIACLESVLLPAKVAAIDRLVRARQLRAGLPPVSFRAREIADATRRGRP